MCIRMWRPVINSHVVPCVPETFTFFILHLFILCVYTHMLRHVGGGESTACGSCFFYHVGPEDPTPIVRLGHKHFYQVNCLTTLLF